MSTLTYDPRTLMPDSNPDERPGRRPVPPQVSPEQYQRLKAELSAPYRPLRQFIYVAFGASGLIGGVIFLSELATGRNVATVLPNFALQLGVVALMVWLFRLEQRAGRRSQRK